jgi:aminopeptidase YwaD
MKMILIALTLVLPFLSPAQKQKKSDQLLLDNLITHIHYLTDDKLEGRRTGSPGEKLASDYISIEFSRAGLQPKGDHNGWLQAFDIDEGRQINTDSYFFINDEPLIPNREFFPLSCSATGSVSGSPAIALQERGVPWFIDLKEILEAGHSDPHFDLRATIRIKIKESAVKGATAVILYNTSKIKDNLRYDPKDRPAALPIPVLYLTKEAKRRYLKDESASLEIRLKTGFTEQRRTGHNVVGYQDNGAPNTVIIAAHYDHLGYGEDGNSRYRGPRQVFHGADDDASGVAAIIELSKMLTASKLKNNNYLFVAFSGKELDLSGSTYFVEHPGIDLSHVNYMLNLDRIGRLNDSSHALTLGGYGTSPVWEQVCSNAPGRKYFSLQYDSSGAGGDAGPSRGAGAGDHIPFYRKDIPVLSFFTGWHSDYHMPTDDADKINYTGEMQVEKYIYDIVQGMNDKGKIAFARTRE